MRVAEQYVEQFGRLAQQSNSLILPFDSGNIFGLVATATPSKKPKPIAFNDLSMRSVRFIGTGKRRRYLPSEAKPTAIFDRPTTDCPFEDKRATRLAAPRKNRFF